MQKQCKSRRPRGASEKISVFAKGLFELLTLKLGACS